MKKIEVEDLIPLLRQLKLTMGEDYSIFLSNSISFDGFLEAADVFLRLKEIQAQIK